MENISINALSRDTDSIVIRAQHERITIEEAGRPVAALVSMADKEFLEKIEDDYWAKIANERHISNEIKHKISSIEDLNALTKKKK